MAVIAYQLAITTTPGRAVPGDAGESNYKALITPSVDALVGGKIWGNGEDYPSDWPGAEGDFEAAPYPVAAGATLSVELEPNEELWIAAASGSGTANVLLAACDAPRTVDGMVFV